MPTVVSSPASPAPMGPYSPALRVGEFLLIASMGPIDPPSGRVVGTDAGEQAHQALANIAALCEEAGASLDDIVRVQLYVSSFEDLEAINGVFREVFTEPFPVRTVIQVGLPPGRRVAVEATAYLAGGRR